MACGETLLVDVPNKEILPYCGVKPDLWERILNREPPYERVSGIYFTHDHPDHHDADRVKSYLTKWPRTPYVLPSGNSESGLLRLGVFEISWKRLEHAPMDTQTPPHVVTWIRAGGRCLYIAADAKLDAEAHRQFLAGKRADAAFWNAMYLSRPETRRLIAEAAEVSYIYHMPEGRTDTFGIWRKCERNLERYSSELENTVILDRYPTEIII